MVTAEEIAARRAVIGDAPALRALRDHLRTRAQPLLERLPPIPEQKALLSVDGGVCADDGTALAFDPWSPSSHRCPRCGRHWTGERHDRHWARYQHLWLVERAAHLAALGALDGQAPAAVRAGEILTGYAERYWRYPNRDNVLGPSRLFFSTYLESVWTTNYLAAAALLRAGGRLDDAVERAVHQVADEAATLIGDYDEGFSNRQTWNNAALAAVAVWFEDEELARRAIEGPTGLLAHLIRGYGRDGMWHEGENYHLFAIRGLLTGLGWARLAGVDVAAESRLAEKLAQALLAPALSALPDFTYPARKDSRYGISLAQPAHVELWEIGLARLGTGDEGRGTRELTNWLHALSQVPAAQPELLESCLHDAPFEPVPRPSSRSTLSWWSLLEMLPEVPAPAEPWTPPTVLLESQGLAVLRAADRYASLECGPYTGGHGHPDRLHLTLHANGVHWLPDPGAGSYVSRDLFWYRSTLAHNAPRLDGVSQAPAETGCDRFDDQGAWAWARGRLGPLTRTLVAGPRYLVDVLDLTGTEERLLELPWHLAGSGDVDAPEAGRWEDAVLDEPFLTKVERFVAPQTGDGVYRITHDSSGARLQLHLVGGKGVELWRAEGPGLPGRTERRRFYLLRTRARNARLVAVLSDDHVRGIRVAGEMIEIDTAAGTETHRYTGDEWTTGDITLHGTRDDEAGVAPLLELERPTPALAPAFRVAGAPDLDGTRAGFDVSEPLRLAIEDQYRRSEEPYPGPAELSATAFVAWDDDALYVAVEITKPDLCFRAPDAPPQRLDNEPEDIHSDGLQIYLRGEGAPIGFLIVPEPGSGLRVSAVSDLNGDPSGVHGRWRQTGTGYAATVAVPWPTGVRPHVGARVRFDLIINEMLPGRTQRAGQLVWSGGNGWVWLRGDRQSPARFGVLELVT